MSCSAAVMISATPALSSAPSRVVPSVVIRVLPFKVFNSGKSDVFKSSPVDGDYEGEVAYENYNAASAVFAVKGVNVHPGEAKDIMVNAALVACEIQSQLPPMETPAHTEGREGFYHLTDMSGDVAAATLSYIIRDHDKVMFETRQKKMQEIADSMNTNTVYEIVIGAIAEDGVSEEYAKIQNEFSEGSECDKLYEEVYEAKQRISQKLHILCLCSCVTSYYVFLCVHISYTTHALISTKTSRKIPFFFDI